MKTILLSLLLSTVLLPAYASKDSVTTAVRNNLQYIIRQKPDIHTEDSLLQHSIQLVQQAGLKAWEVRLLNFWSQQKVSQADYPLANQLISSALLLCKQETPLLQSVDYRDALVQKTMVLFYLEAWDSCLQTARLGITLSKHTGDLFNESILLTNIANVYGNLNQHSDSVLNLYKEAGRLAKQTPSLHDDVMMQHNYSFFLRAAPFFRLKESMEVLLALQDISEADELVNYRYQPWQRTPFYFRGTHILLLRQLAEDYYFLQEPAQAVPYADEITSKLIAFGRIKYAPYTLVYRSFLGTMTSQPAMVQQLLDSAVHLMEKYHHKSAIPVSHFYYSKAWLYEQGENWNEALSNYREAMNYAPEKGVNEHNIALFRCLIKKGDTKRADSLYTALEKKLDSSIVSYYKIYYYKELPAYYRLKHNETAALLAETRYYKLKDSLTGISAYMIAAGFEKKFRLNEKDKQLALAAKEKDLNRQQLALRNKQTFWLTAALIALTASLVLLGIIYRMKQKQAARLREKNEQIETMSRELHHRVKNNLQLVSGLLSLQASRVPDAESRKILEESTNRVDVMALIHQKLYIKPEQSAVNLEEYLRELVNWIAGSFSYPPEVMQCSFQQGLPAIDIDKAIPLGLIINELVTNIFKYAYPDGSEPEAKIAITYNSGQLVLEVADHGVGIKKENISNRSFGLRLVQLLVQQLNGSSTSNYQNGTCYTITIPLE